MEKLRSACSFVSTLHVEPMLFLSFIATTACSTGVVSLATQKICFPDGPPGIAAVCENTDAVKDAADLNTVRGMIRAFLPAVVVILFGSWRDMTHRSLPLIVISLLMEMLATGLELASSLYWEVSPWSFTIASCVLGGSGGSTAVVVMASLSYVTENSRSEEKALRIPILMVAMLGGVSISMAVSGMLLNSLDYLGFFLLVLSLFGASMLLAVLMMKDKPTNASGGYFESVKHLKMVFDSRPNTFQIWTFIFSISLTTTLLSAEGTVGYLFLQKKFQASPKVTSPLSGYRMFSAIFGAAVATPLLKHLLKLSDFKVCIICVIPSIIGCIGSIFAESVEEMYIFGTLDCLRITYISTMMNLFTESIKRSEVGIFSSLLGFAEGVLPLGLNPLYLYVFKWTVDSLPGAFYLISVSSITLSAILIWIISWTYKAYEETENNQENNEIHEVPGSA